MLEPEPTTNTAHEENRHPCNTIRLSGRDMNCSAFRRPAGTLEHESEEAVESGLERNEKGVQVVQFPL
jgi:hypothetical protein